MTITIYTGESCHACDATERALLSAGHDYTATPATDEHRERFRSAGHRSLPVVVVTNDAGETLEEWSGFRPDKINALEMPS
jgi:glutaredoxin-like protein NrdH